MSTEPLKVMSTAAEPSATAGPPPSAMSTTERVERRASFAWADSIWFDLAISFLVGLLYMLVLWGPMPLNPRHIDWLLIDSGDYYAGWALFRDDPHWHWPLTHTDYVGYPIGLNVALMDINPLLAVLLKPLSPLLGEPFQYFGIESVLVCALQFFFSVRLFRLPLGANRLGAWLCSVFFLAAPPLMTRLGGHFSLTNHWLLLAALLVYFQAQEESPRAMRRFVISAIILAAVAVGTNPYLAFQVLLVLTATAGSLLWQRRWTLRRAAGFVAVLGATSLIVAYSLGFFISGGKGYVSPGYRFLAMNLLEPVSPYIFGPTVCGAILSRVVPYVPHPTTDMGNYLGAGVIFLGIFLLIALAMRPGKRPSFDKRRMMPLVVCCLLLTLMALSTRVTAGRWILVDFDPWQHLTRFLAPLRASDRLFWTPYYAILLTVLAGLFRLLRRSQANAVLAVMLAVQLIDIAPLGRWVHSWVNTPQASRLHSPLWSQLGSVHENLIVLPAWQCGPYFSPGKHQGFRIFGYLAAAQKMRTNSYFSGRYPQSDRDFHCKQEIAALGERPLSPDSAYVVAPELAKVIAKGPTGPGKCHEVDGFFLCSTKLDFGAAGEAKSRE
jgi:Family of unknown function (DUF6311)